MKDSLAATRAKLTEEVKSQVFKDLTKHNDQRLAAWTEHSMALYANANISNVIAVAGIKSALLSHVVAAHFHTGSTLQDTIEMVQHAWRRIEEKHKS